MYKQAAMAGVPFVLLNSEINPLTPTPLSIPPSIINHNFQCNVSVDEGMTGTITIETTQYPGDDNSWVPVTDTVFDTTEGSLIITLRGAYKAFRAVVGEDPIEGGTAVVSYVGFHN